MAVDRNLLKRYLIIAALGLLAGASPVFAGRTAQRKAGPRGTFQTFHRRSRHDLSHAAGRREPVRGRRARPELQPPRRPQEVRDRPPEQAGNAAPPWPEGPGMDRRPLVSCSMGSSHPGCFGYFRFMLLAMALCHGLPGAGGTSVPLQAHGDYVAQRTAAFNETLALAGLPAPPMAGPPDPPANLTQALDQFRNASAALRTEPPATAIAGLRASLASFQPWLAQELAQARGAMAASALGGTAPPPLLPALTTQLTALEGLSNGMQVVSGGYLTGALGPAEAVRLIRLASDTLINIVNSFRVAAQSLALSTYGPQPEVPDSPCCEYADLMAEYTIQQVLGAAGATNVAAYIVATEAAAELAGAAVLPAAGSVLSAPARLLLAGTDLTSVTAAALSAQVLAPPPGAVPAAWFPGPGIVLDPAVWGNTSQALAARCGAAPCDHPATRAMAVVAGETLAGSIMNVVGLALFSVATQLTLAMEPPPASAVTMPGPDPAQPMAWTGSLMRQFQGRALQTLSAPRLAALLGTVPHPQADGAGLTRTLQDEYWPALAGMSTGAVPPPSRLTGMLSGLYQASAGLAPAPGPARQFHGQVTAFAQYALATANGYQSGAVERPAALTLLADIADSLQALVYAWLIEASAVPLEVSLLYQQGAIAPLTEARARALGLGAQPTAAEQSCRDACRQAQRRLQAASDAIAGNATRTYLTAYIEALTGSIISEALDVAAPVPAGNGTASRRLLQAASAAPVPALARLYQDCPPCDLAFSGQRLALAEETRDGAGLTLMAYTLNLVVKGLRIAVAAESGG